MFISKINLKFVKSNLKCCYWYLSMLVLSTNKNAFFIIMFRDCKGKIKGGYRLKPQHFRRWSIPIRVLSDVPISRNWYKTDIIFSKYATNLKTTIYHRSLKKWGLLLVLFKFNNISCLINIITNIIKTSVSRDQNSHQ